MEIITEFVVKPARLDRAKKLIAEHSRTLDQNQIYALFDEVNWGDKVSMAPKGNKLKFSLSDMEIVMLAAALVALAENGGETREAEITVVEDNIPF